MRYPNGAIGVTDISLTLPEHEVGAVFGPNGAGKTTTVRAITGFLRSEARIVHGHVSLFGKDVTNWEPHRISRLGVSFVPERHKVFGNMSVSDNLKAVGTLPPRRLRGEIQEQIFSLFPNLARYRRKLAGTLSGGEQQMIAIARGLINQPRLLIIDELTLGLHPSVQAPLFDALHTISQQGTSVLLVDENTGFAVEFADKCYLVRSGHVTDSGPSEKYVGADILAAGYV